MTNDSLVMDEKNNKIPAAQIKSKHTITTNHGQDQHSYGLARRYRPVRLADMVGQDILVKTLSQAISIQRVHHAYLFTGTRGVGKTTAARVLAASLNCARVDQPTLTPCGSCSVCRDINEGNSYDVHELDAASHNSVEQIRELIATVGYQPSSRFKVYILDEVHVLSAQAFNALLKTIEEPPAHVVFILATTELHKIPRTIMSRCQIFGLRPVSVAVLAQHLRAVCVQENVADRMAEEALHLLAIAAEGSVREGLSFLEQTLTFVSDGIVGVEQVSDVLGITTKQEVWKVFATIMDRDPRTLLLSLRELGEQGRSARSILQILLDMLHALSVVVAWQEADTSLNVLKNVDTARRDDLLWQHGIPPAWNSQWKRWQKQHSIASLSRLWQILLKGQQNDIAIAINQWQALEMVLLRAVYAAAMPLPIDLLALKDMPTSVPQVDVTQKVPSVLVSNDSGRDEYLVVEENNHNAQKNRDLKSVQPSTKTGRVNTGDVNTVDINADCTKTGRTSAGHSSVNEEITQNEIKSTTQDDQRHSLSENEHNVVSDNEITHEVTHEVTTAVDVNPTKGQEDTKEKNGHSSVSDLFPQSQIKSIKSENFNSKN